MFFSALVVLAIISMFYLFFNAVMLNEFVPKNITSVLVRGSLIIIITAFPAGLYDMTRAPFFGALTVIFFIVSLSFALAGPIYNKIRVEYRKKYSTPESSNEWICKKCGESNYKINKICMHCGSAAVAQY